MYILSIHNTYFRHMYREQHTPPAKVLDDIGAEEDDDKCRGPYQRRVVAHENLRV
jgi:hypothetical protein